MPTGVLRNTENADLFLNSDRVAKYDEEKKAIKDAFSQIGDKINWEDPAPKKLLNQFASLVIDNVSKFMDTRDLVDMVLPAVNLNLGETFVEREMSGVNIYYGTYGASVRMSRPNFAQYTVKPNLKEVGLDFVLAEIRSGKYSPSELSDYTTGLISAWRNNLLFTTTLGGITAFQSGGAQYTAGTKVGFATLDAAIADITDESDLGFMVGRRTAIHKISRSNGAWSDNDKSAINRAGQVGTYMGMPVMKVNSFTDPDYGDVYPMASDVLWLFSGLPIGKIAYADRLNSSQETEMRTGRLKIYLRWDDGIGIWRTNRAAVIGAIT